MGSAEDQTIDEAIQFVKDLFPLKLGKLFNLTIPKIDIDGGTFPWGIGGKGTPPSISVGDINWFKKAMDGGIILDGATIFGMMNGQLLGGGEAGRELIVGVNSLQNMIRQSMARNNITTAEIYSAVKAGMKDANVVVYMDGRKVTEGVNRQNDMIAQSRARMQGAY